MPILITVLVVLFALAVFGGVFAIFGFMAKHLVARAKRYQQASGTTFPAFAEKHGLRLDPRGSPDGMTALEGLYEGVMLRIELVHVQHHFREVGEGRPTVSLIPATRITARTSPDLPSSFSIRLGPSHDEGFERADVSEGMLTGNRASLLGELGRSRKATLRAFGGGLTLEWLVSEDDVVVLEQAADLCAAFSRVPAG
jgi:hypothetical protein